MHDQDHAHEHATFREAEADRSAPHRHDHDAGGWRAARERVLHAVVPHAHDHAEAIEVGEDSTEVGIRASWISLAGMGATALLQIAIVAISGSVALLADTVHNLGHLATTVPLIIAFHWGRRRPSRTYPYGFHRAEDLVGLLIGAVIALSAGLIVWESIRAVTGESELTNLGWVLAAALVGAAGNEAVAIYRIRAGTRIGSAALVAEGQHARTDALTSLAVVVGVVGAWLGLPWVDPVIGLLIGAVVVGVLVRSMRVVLRRLMDGVEPGTVERLAEAAAEVPGIDRVVRVRARWSGHRLLAQVDVEVPAERTIGAAEGTNRSLGDVLRRSVPHLADVEVSCSPSPAVTEFPPREER